MTWGGDLIGAGKLRHSGPETPVRGGKARRTRSVWLQGLGHGDSMLGPHEFIGNMMRDFAKSKAQDQSINLSQKGFSVRSRRGELVEHSFISPAPAPPQASQMAHL